VSIIQNPGDIEALTFPSLSLKMSVAQQKINAKMMTFMTVRMLMSRDVFSPTVSEEA
jgi:hypothetical protein